MRVPPNAHTRAGVESPGALGERIQKKPDRTLRPQDVVRGFGAIGKILEQSSATGPDGRARVAAQRMGDANIHRVRRAMSDEGLVAELDARSSGTAESLRLGRRR